MDLFTAQSAATATSSAGYLGFEAFKLLFQATLTVGVAIVGGWVRSLKKTTEENTKTLGAIAVQLGQVNQWREDHVHVNIEQSDRCDESHRRLRTDLTEMSTTVQRVAAVQDLCRVCQRKVPEA